MRTHRRWFAGVWLLCQLAALAAAPVALGAAHLSVGAAVVEQCDCPGAGPGDSCPMHPHGKPRESSSDCRLESACPPTDAALLSLLGGMGVPCDTGTDADVDGPAEALVLCAVPARSRAAGPESPPPRSR